MIFLTPCLLTIDTEEDRLFIAGLYEAHCTEMKLFARKLVGERFAEDVLHNAFQKLIQNIEKLKEIEPYKRRSYIYATVKSCAYDIMRKENKYTEIDEEYMQILSEDAPTVIDKILDKEGYEALKSCIRCLKASYREICEMKYILHMKEREIAEAMGLTEKNVNSRIQRGKQVLRKMILEKYGYDYEKN